MPKVSVIIPVYGVEKYIARCARSLFEQTLDEIEYIFINDCTPDNSMNILKEIANKYPHRLPYIHIINHIKNTGQSKAREDGMSIATGDYIIHCDADDWIELDMYESMYKTAIENHVDAVCCDMSIEFPNKTEIRRYNCKYEDHQLMYNCLAPIDVVYFSMCNRLISKKIFQANEIKPFRGVNMWDDVGLTVRLRYFIQSCIILNRPFYHYNKSNENSTTLRPTKERIEEQIKCVKKIEEFFYTENNHKKYKYFISLIKFKAKADWFDNNINLWYSIFPECHRHLWNIHKAMSKKIWLKYLKAILFEMFHS